LILIHESLAAKSEAVVNQTRHECQGSNDRSLL
jgi:hypothetical protein